MKSPARPPVVRSERTVLSLDTSASSSRISDRTTIKRISPNVVPARAQNVRVVRSFSSSAATRWVTSPPPFRP